MCYGLGESCSWRFQFPAPHQSWFSIKCIFLNALLANVDLCFVLPAVWLKIWWMAYYSKGHEHHCSQWEADYTLLSTSSPGSLGVGERKIEIPQMACKRHRDAKRRREGLKRLMFLYTPTLPHAICTLCLLLSNCSVANYPKIQRLKTTCNLSWFFGLIGRFLCSSCLATFQLERQPGCKDQHGFTHIADTWYWLLSGAPQISSTWQLIFNCLSQGSYTFRIFVIQLLNHWWLEVSHSGSAYTTKIGKYSNHVFFFWSADLPGHRCLHLCVSYRTHIMCVLSVYLLYWIFG